MEKLRNLERRTRAIFRAASSLVFFFTALLHAGPVVFHLKNGDRIAGDILCERTNSVVLRTSWADEIVLPLEQIGSRELPPVVDPPSPPVELAAPIKAAKAPPREWRADARMGMDLINGAKDRQIYFGQFALKYARPYATRPGEFFRNALEFRADYAKTDGIESANRIYGSDKADFDLSRRWFVYNYAGAGYDDVRKVDLQYELGPGFGCHLLRATNFTVNLEGGLNYQSQQRHDSPEIEALYGRTGEDITWKISPQVTLTQRAALLTRVDEPEQMQLRLEANLSMAVVKNVFFNFTALQLYDSRPVPGVTQSEFQLRSSLGVTF